MDKRRACRELELVDNPLVENEMIGGIHQSILGAEGAGLIVGAYSHKILEYSLTKEIFYVGDCRPQRKLFFKMEYKHGDLEFEAFTRDTDHARRPHHPDLFARLLFDSSVDYFENLYGASQVRRLHAYWIRGHDNYIQYRSALNRYNGHEPREQRRRAAFATWTGAQATRRAFTELDGGVRLRNNGREINVTFMRPDTDQVY